MMAAAKKAQDLEALRARITELQVRVATLERVPRSRPEVVASLVTAAHRAVDDDGVFARLRGALHGQQFHLGATAGDVVVAAGGSRRWAESVADALIEQYGTGRPSSEVEAELEAMRAALLEVEILEELELCRLEREHPGEPDKWARREDADGGAILAAWEQLP